MMRSKIFLRRAIGEISNILLRAGAGGNVRGQVSKLLTHISYSTRVATIVRAGRETKHLDFTNQWEVDYLAGKKTVALSHHYCTLHPHCSRLGTVQKAVKIVVCYYVCFHIIQLQSSLRTIESYYIILRSR